MVEPSNERPAPSAKPLRVGVIGLGPLWQRRYRPALAALNQRFQVAGLCDQVEQHAIREARRLDCAVTSGPTALLEDDAVEALLLLDPQWYRLWPLELAGRLGKPVLCCSPLDLDDAHADDLYRQLSASRLPVLRETAWRLAPAFRRLRELLATTLGPARLLLCESAAAQRDHREEGEPQGEGALLDCCGDLLAGEPVGVLAAGSSGGALTSLLLEFDNDRAIQITRYATSGSRGGLRLRAVTEHGSALLEFPNRVHWTDGAGGHTHVLAPERPLGQVLLEQFYRVAREGQPPEPDLDRAYRLLGWVRAAARSRAQGRRVDLRSQEDKSSLS